MVILILLAFKLGSRSGEQQRSSSSPSIKLESSSITSHERETEIVVPSPVRISRKLDEPFSDSFNKTQTIGISIANAACKKGTLILFSTRSAPSLVSTGGSLLIVAHCIVWYITIPTLVRPPQIRTARRRIDTRKSMGGQSQFALGPGMARCESRTEPFADLMGYRRSGIHRH